MTENCFFIAKQSFLDLITGLGGQCDSEKGTRRPMYCCIKDSIIDGLYWAIPTSDLSHRTVEQRKKYDEYLKKDERDLRSCYYHIGRTTKPALFKVSSCVPITEKYVDHEFTTNGEVVVLKNKSTISEIERKLRRILAFESSRPNYFPQRITDIKDSLVKELSLPC